MTEIRPFDFQGHEVRVLADDPDNPWWVAADVAKVLGYSGTAAMSRSLDEDEKGVRTLHTPGGDQQMTVITESGLYSGILRSTIPQAKEFKRWVTREVLPSIRRHGGYLTQPTVEQILSDPDTLIKLATDLKAEREARADAEYRAQELEAPARSCQHLAAPGGDFSVSTAAKVLSRDPDIEIGRDRLFKHMSALRWIFRRGEGKRRHWEAYQQKAIATGRLVHKISAPFLNERTGDFEQPAPTIRVTPKGLHELHVSLGGVDQTALFDDETIDHS